MNHSKQNMLFSHLSRIWLPMLAALCLLTFSACSGEQKAAAKDAAAIDAGEVSFTPTVYYARDGRIRFLYDNTSDMLSALEGYDMAALYAGNVYSMVLTYEEGTVSRKDADKAIREEFDLGEGVMSLSKKTKSTEVSGYPFRRAEITGSDGSSGAVLYGTTATGYAKIYYILSPDADEEDRAHVEEILSTVRLAEFEDGGIEDEVKIYVQ